MLVQAGVCVLLDAEDLPYADRKSIYTQLTVFQKQFYNKKPNSAGKRRWNNHK